MAKRQKRHFEKVLVAIGRCQTLFGFGVSSSAVSEEPLFLSDLGQFYTTSSPRDVSGSHVPHCGLLLGEPDMFLTTFHQSTVVVWELTDGIPAPKKILKRPGSLSMNRLCSFAEGMFATTSDRDSGQGSFVSIWNLDSGNVTAEVETSKQSVQCVTYAADSLWVSGYEPYDVTRIDPVVGKILSSGRFHTRNIRGMAAMAHQDGSGTGSPLDNAVFTGCFGGKVGCWSHHTPEEAVFDFTTSYGPIVSLLAVPPFRLMVGGSGHLSLIDLRMMKQQVWHRAHRLSEWGNGAKSASNPCGIGNWVRDMTVTKREDGAPMEFCGVGDSNDMFFWDENGTKTAETRQMKRVKAGSHGYMTGCCVVGDEVANSLLFCCGAVALEMMAERLGFGEGLSDCRLVVKDAVVISVSRAFVQFCG